MTRFEEIFRAGSWHEVCSLQKGSAWSIRKRASRKENAKMTLSIIIPAWDDNSLQCLQAFDTCKAALDTSLHRHAGKTMMMRGAAFNNILSTNYENNTDDRNHFSHLEFQFPACLPGDLHSEKRWRWLPCSLQWASTETLSQLLPSSIPSKRWLFHRIM